jgi:hypothetical protein
MVTVLDPDPGLLEAVSRLPGEEFERFLCQVAARRTQAPSPSERESELLLKISEGASPETWEAFRNLRDKKDRGELTAADEAQIADVIESLENHAAQRVRWLAELAGLRSQTVSKLLDSLQLQPEHG